MFIEAQMVFKSYAPLKLEKGMLFLYSELLCFQLRQLDHVPADEQEYIKENGYPVEPYIVEATNPNERKSERILATPEQIGWFDEGEWSDELCDIELKHYNRILEGYAGSILIEMFETDEEELSPTLYNNKVTIAYADLEDEYDDDDDEELTYEEDDYDNDTHTEGDF